MAIGQSDSQIEVIEKFDTYLLLMTVDKYRAHEYR